MSPIQSVGVIGAGISGVSSAAHLLRYGFEVVVFERSDFAGGVWHFDPRADQDPPYPSGDDASTNGVPASTKKEDKQDAEAITLAHAPPGPCYEGLMNNVPTTMMRSTLLQWPKGTPDHVTHHEIETYVQTLARTTGANDVTQYNTLVEEAVKNPSTNLWTVKTKTLHHSPTNEITFTHQTHSFDALVVAAGHYHVPLIPHIPGLTEWKEQFPTRILHSKSYRRPRDFEGQNVLLIGAGVSSLDIAKELDGVAARTYQSSRGGIFDLDASLLPNNSERVGGLSAFKLEEGKSFDGSGASSPGAPIPGTVHLKDGRILSNIHSVIVASGYLTTYPFLKGLEREDVDVEEADGEVVITADKCVTHNLHKDIFYIPDPTLSFVGVPYYTSTFSMFDFQAEVVARVWKELAVLPSEGKMRAEYEARKAKGDKGKAFHSLIRNQVPYMDEILAWVNESCQDKGIEPMKGVDEEWHRGYSQFKAKSRLLIPAGSSQIQQPIASKYYQDTS